MSWFTEYVRTLNSVLESTEVTNHAGNSRDCDETLKQLWSDLTDTHAAGGKVMFIGNGGSAGIASHSAIDYSKNGNVRSLAFNDGAALTCMGNDFGYEHVFSKQIEIHARSGDVLFAISSSGQSRNILNAVESARAAGCRAITLSGFNHENPLRSLGDINFYLASDEYGFVELGHQILIHSILDRGTGLKLQHRALD